MAYGTVKVDNVTFTYNSADATTTFSGFYASTTNNLTLSGTASAATFTGTTANFTNVNAQNISVTTITGTTASFTSGVFTSLSGTTHTITSGVFASGTAALPSISFVSDPNTGVFSPGADQLAVATNGTQRLIVDGSGRVGVGVTPSSFSASYKILQFGIDGVLNASTTTANGVILAKNFFNNGSNNLYINTDFASFYQQISGEHQWFTAPSGTAGNAITFTQKMALDASGRLGIGSSSPNRTLHVFGDQAFSNSNNTGTFLFAPAAAANYIYSRAADSAITAVPLTIAMGSTDVVHINTSGRVGIGTTGPDANSQLHIVGSSYQPLYVNTTAAGGGGAVFFRSGTQALYAGTAGSSWLSGSSTADGLIRSEANLIFATGGNTQRAQIDSSGRLLVGTSTARTDYFNNTLTAMLQVEGINSSGATDRACVSIVNNNSLTLNEAPVLVFGRSNGSALNSKTIVSNGTRCGYISFQGADGSDLIDAASITGEIDGTPGANDMPGRLVFSTTADGASSPTERMRIGNNGAVSINKGFAIGSATGQGADKFYIDGTVMASGAGNSTLKWSTSTGFVTYDTSSRLVKEQIVDCPYGIDALKQLKPRKYFRTDDQRDEIGFVADEMVQVMPEFVPIGPKSVITKNENDTEQIPIGVNYEKLTAVLTNALQEAIAKIETLEARLTAAGID